MRYTPMFGNSVPYQNPAESTSDVPPQFAGHEEAWSILSSQLGLLESDLSFMPAEDQASLMMLVDQLEQNLISQDVFVASARDLLPDSQVGGGTAGGSTGGGTPQASEIPDVLQGIPDADDAWAAISQNLNMSKAAFESVFDPSYAVLLRIAATEFVSEQITEAQFVEQVRALLGLGGPASSFDDACPPEFVQAGIEYAWSLLLADGWSRSMWDSYPADMRDRILQKAYVLFGGNQAVTEFANQEFLEFAYLQRETAERQAIESQSFDPATVPAPSAQYTRVQDQVEASLKIVFGSAGIKSDVTRHDLAFAMTIYADAIESNSKVAFTHEMLLQTLDYFIMLGFPDYSPVELATIMAMVNAGQTAVLNAERRAMALDSNRTDALCQTLNKQIVLAAFGPKSRAQLDKFCAQTPAVRENDLENFYENDLALLLGITKPQLLEFMLSNFDARVTGQLADLGSRLEAGAPAPTADQVTASLPGLNEVQRGIPATRATPGEQKSIIRRPTAPQRGANTTSGARFAEALLPPVDKMKLGAIFTGAAVGLAYLTYSIYNADDRRR